MSWWVYLVNDLDKYESDDRDYDMAVCEVGKHTEGGTYAVGGIDTAQLNITYNYGGYFREAVDGLAETGLKGLHHQKAGDWIDKLEAAVQTLGVEQDMDYWAPTEGNAGHALSILLSWAKQHPEAIFVVH